MLDLELRSIALNCFSELIHWAAAKCHFNCEYLQWMWSCKNLFKFDPLISCAHFVRYIETHNFLDAIVQTKLNKTVHADTIHFEMKFQQQQRSNGTSSINWLAENKERTIQSRHNKKTIRNKPSATLQHDFAHDFSHDQSINFQNYGNEEK